MSGMTHTKFYTTLPGRLVKWPRLCALLALLLARAALGTDPTYENDGIVDYTGGAFTDPPQIDATNFINANGAQFIILPALYETWNTVNYTNDGYMDGGVGFWFDTQTTNVIPHQMAGSFYNPGEVDCGYQFLAWATNILNPGTVNVPGTGVIVNANPLAFATAIGGLMQITGQNVDLTGSALTIVGGQGSAQVIGLYGLTGTDTNSDWDASFDLGPTYAYPSFPVSGLLPPSLGGFGFPNVPLNTTPYFNIVGVGTNTIIYRAVFLQDASGVNVSHNVYFGTAGVVGGGDVTVEWVGSYVDPTTGISASHYLYLNNDYVQSVVTNELILNGIPYNFQFAESPTQIGLGTPTAAGFLNVFDSGFVSNRFAYVSAQMIATSAGTNSIPNHSITNLPQRIQINASKELNLALAQIAQPDYLSVQATNQYDGNAGARIAAPFSDLNLGVTNGFNGPFTITNLLPQSFPIWGGTVQAWSTRWVALSTNTVIVFTNTVPPTPIATNTFLVTNDFRVVIVASQLAPTFVAQVQNLILNDTNSVVISDAFNIMRSLSINAQSLTLTTNVYGNGASSADGELNLESAGILWPGSLPNLLWLTNNGAISTINLANFGSAAQPYGAFVNSGRVSNLGGSAIWARDFENYGTFFSGSGSFNLQSLTTTMTNGSVVAGGNIAIVAASMVVSNSVLSAGAALNLTVTNLLTDTGPTNGNIWQLGSKAPSASPGIYFNNGFNLPIKPPAGDLLGTTVSNVAPPQVVNGLVTNINVTINNLWSGLDYGVSNSGYTNNVAVGHLILDAQGKNSLFKFYGTGASNAIYVDRLELRDYASWTNLAGRDIHNNLLALVFNTNLVVYYADAIASGAGDVSLLLNQKNNGHLRWVPSYAGYFSSTNIVYAGVTNPVNIALAEGNIDSYGGGVENINSSLPIPPTMAFLSSQGFENVHFTSINANTATIITWNSIPAATNTVYYKASLIQPWIFLTNFVSATNYPPAAWPLTNSVIAPLGQPLYVNIPQFPNWYDTYFGFQ